MEKAIIAVIVILLAGCAANQAAFSPDIEARILPQQSTVNLNEDDILVTVENVGEIAAYEVEVDISVNGQSVEDETISSLPNGDDERYEFTVSDLEEYCEGSSELTVRVGQNPNGVKDLNAQNNEASTVFTC